MTGAAFTFFRSSMVLNTAADVSNPIFIGSTYFHVKHPAGGYVSIDPATGLPAATGALKVGGRENLQYTEGEPNCVLNISGPPFGALSVLVAIHL